MQELISVLMPTYNVVNFVQDAVNSILSQTYQNIELIIVDDCSTDGTYELLSKLASEDSRIRLFRNEKNSKICKTLNRGLQEVKGSYIARMDGDDICDFRRLEIMKSYLDNHIDIALVGSWIYSIDEEENILTKKKFLCKPENIRKNIYIQNCVLHIWLARKEIYDTLNGYRDIPYVEDYDFLLRGLRFGFRYANIPQYLYSVRTRMGNTGSTNGLRQQKAKYYVRNLNKKEMNCGKDLFDYDNCQEYIAGSTKEIGKYNIAFRQLQVALSSRNNKIKMMKYTLISFWGSMYIRKHLIESILMRVKIKKEQKKA